MLPQFSMSSDYGSSPTLFYPRPYQHPHHQRPFFQHEPYPSSLQSPSSQWSSTTTTNPASIPPINLNFNSSYVAPSTRPAQRQSRKRSRDEFTADEESAAPSVEPNGMDIVDEPVYGEGMTLIDPKTGRTVGAGSQTGTWYEENLELERRAAEEAALSLERDRLEALGRAPKSVRLDSPSAPEPQSQALPQAPPQQPQPLQQQVQAAPAIDQASLALGIGWKAVASDPDMACAARGWARYIENHYPQLGGSGSGVEIACRSEGLDAFLVRATQPVEGWWLFKDDLSEGRFVSGSFEGCVEALRGGGAEGPFLEGAESVFAAASPSPRAEEQPGVGPEVLLGLGEAEMVM